MTDKTLPRTLPADARGIEEAAAILRQGGLVALPTETVYGLAARADSEDAVARIYRAKGRPAFNPLIVHVADVAKAKRIAHFDERAERLARAFWPGALTLVLPRRTDAVLAPAVTAGLPTVALRCPADPVMRSVLTACGLPLAAPSANPSGAVSPTTAAHVAKSLGSMIDAVLDGGPCSAGIESTIAALRDDGSWQLLRPGPLTEREIASRLGRDAAPLARDGGVEAPGQMPSHYAPGKPLRLNAESAEADEFHIGFADIAGDINLSAGGDLLEAAAALYAALHLASSSTKPRIAVAPIPSDGVGEAINDRLRRAAS